MAAPVVEANVAAVLSPLGNAIAEWTAPAEQVPVSPVDAGFVMVMAEASDKLASSIEAPSPEDLAASEFRATLGARCRILMESAARESDDADLAELLDRLSDPDVDVIRQPPLAAQRALAIARNPETSLAEMVAIFGSDPSMAQGLLATANSVVYRLDKEACQSVGHAVQRVGARAVEGVILGRLVEGMLCRPGSAYAGHLADIWSHMTRTAPLARNLGITFMLQPDQAFTMGLMHDIGKLVVLDQLSDLRKKHQREVRISPRTLNTLLGRLHEPLGGLAMLVWELGLGSARSVASHHREPTPPWSDPMSELLFVAERAEHALRRRQPMDLDRCWNEGGLSVNRSDLMEALRDTLNVQLIGSRLGLRGSGGEPTAAAKMAA